VRDFGLDLLRRNHRLGNAFGLFRLNYEPGDSVAFMEALEVAGRTSDPEILHGAGLDLRGVFEERVDPESVEILLEAGVIPDEVLRECLDDCDPGTRELARAAIGA
jgi:hypothetical protein